MSTTNLGVFIHWQAFKDALFEAHQLQPDAELLFDAIKEYGAIQLARVYANWQDPNLRKDRDTLQKLGAEVIQSEISTSVHITADLVYICQRQKQLGTLILITAGADFLPLNTFLPRLGKTVKFIGIEATMQDVLQHAPSNSLIYDRDIASISRHQVNSADNTALESNLENAYAWIEDLLRQVRSQGMTPSNLESVMVHLYGFDIQGLGISFEQLLQQMVADKRIVLQEREGKQYAILANAAQKPVISSTPQQPKELQVFLQLVQRAGRPVALNKILHIMAERHNIQTGKDFRAQLGEAQKQGLLRLAKNKKDNQWYVAPS